MTLLEGIDSRMSTQRGRKEAVQAVAAGPLTPIVKAATAGLEVHDDFKQLHEALQAADDTGKGAIVLIEAGWLTNASATAAAQRTHWCRQIAALKEGGVCSFRFRKLLCTSVHAVIHDAHDAC